MDLHQEAEELRRKHQEAPPVHSRSRQGQAVVHPWMAEEDHARSYVMIKTIAADPPLP